MHSRKCSARQQARDAALWVVLLSAVLVPEQRWVYRKLQCSCCMQACWSCVLGSLIKGLSDGRARWRA
jgi:hypothetical protein